MVSPPAPIRVNAGTSYRHTNFSPRYRIERKVLKRMAVIELVEIKTKSQNGRAITCSTPPKVIRKKPVIH